MEKKNTIFIVLLFFIFLFLTFLILIILSGCSLNKNLNKNIYQNTSQNNLVVNNDTITNSTTNTINSYNTQKLLVTKPLEEILYSFSTQILDKEEGRQNNIRLTCSSLNGTIVKAYETFSFCDTVGKATEEKGYQKAKIFDANGNVTMGLGGGNCQVSSTLYNAILQDPNFEIVERHPHAQRVYYVEER